MRSLTQMVFGPLIRIHPKIWIVFCVGGCFLMVWSFIQGTLSLVSINSVENPFRKNEEGWNRAMAPRRFLERLWRLLHWKTVKNTDAIIIFVLCPLLEWGRWQMGTKSWLVSLKGKRQLGRSRRRWDDIIKGKWCVDWVYFARYGNRLRAFVDTVMKLRF